jgi:hypothetical protein
MIGGYAFNAADGLQAAEYRRRAQSLEIEALAARQHSGWELARLRRSQGEDDVLRRLLERLEERIEGIPAELVRLIDDVALVARLIGREVELLAQTAGVIHAAVRGGIDLDDIRAAPFGDLAAEATRVVGLGREPSFRLLRIALTQAVDRLGQQSGGAGLANATRAAEQIGMANPPGGQLVLQGPHDILLPPNLSEQLGAPSSVEDT